MPAYNEFIEKTDFLGLLWVHSIPKFINKSRLGEFLAPRLQGFKFVRTTSTLIGAAIAVSTIAAFIPFTAPYVFTGLSTVASFASLTVTPLMMAVIAAVVAAFAVSVVAGVIRSGLVAGAAAKKTDPAAEEEDAAGKEASEAPAKPKTALRSFLATGLSVAAVVGLGVLMMTVNPWGALNMLTSLPMLAQGGVILGTAAAVALSFSVVAHAFPKVSLPQSAKPSAGAAGSSTVGGGQAVAADTAAVAASAPAPARPRRDSDASAAP